MCNEWMFDFTASPKLFTVNVSRKLTNYIDIRLSKEWLEPDTDGQQHTKFQDIID